MAMVELEVLSFVMRLGSTFMLDGSPFYANGWNSYWMLVMAADASTRPRVDAVLRDGAALGLTVCRAWAFNDGGGTQCSLQLSPGNYDEAVFQGLDYVIYQAQQNGVRLLLTLVNNWEDFGGKPQYVAWAQEEGENVDNEDDFFTNPKCRQYYKNHVKAVLTRVNTITQVEYRDDPTIFGWELINEPRCESDPSGATLQAWVGEMAEYVKSIDNKHLLTVGTEGFYLRNSKGCRSANPSSYFDTLGTDFVENHGLPEIDFATVHGYPDSWLSEDADADEKLEFFSAWVDAHKVDSENLLGMPLLVTEFGLSQLKPGFTESKREEYYSIVYDAVYSAARAQQGAAAGALQWQLLPSEMNDWDDGYGIDPSCESTLCNLISLQSARLKASYWPVCALRVVQEVLLGNATLAHPQQFMSNLAWNQRGGNHRVVN